MTPIPDEVKCDKCDGTGTYEGLPFGDHGHCPYCDGTAFSLPKVVAVIEERDRLRLALKFIQVAALPDGEGREALPGLERIARQALKGDTDG